MTNRDANIPSGWRNVKRYCSDTYRTKDGKAYFEFRFVDVGRYFEIDIGAMPSYGNRSQNPHEIHYLPSRRGGRRICVGNESAIKTLSIAKKTAVAWAEQTWRYIKDGTPFSNL
jgi:hypothetical protein